MEAKPVSSLDEATSVTLTREQWIAVRSLAANEHSAWLKALALGPEWSHRICRQKIEEFNGILSAIDQGLGYLQRNESV